MKASLRILPCLLALSLVLAACGNDEPDPPQYETFTSEEGRFRADFPGVPTREARTEAAGEINLNLVHYSVDNGDEAVSVSFIDYPEAIAAQDPRALLDGIAEGAANAANGSTQGTESELKSKTPTTFDGHQAIDFEVEIQNRMLNARAVLVGPRMYLMQVVSEPDIDSESYQRLTSSFTLI